MRHTPVLFALALCLPAPALAAEPTRPLDPCHAPTLSGGVRGPVLSTRVAPRYPARARSEGKESLVVLEVAVRKDGTVGEAKPLRVDEKGYGFESAAIEALKQWKFRPASKEGEPVEVRCSLIFDFTLDEEPEPATPAPDAAAAPSRPGR